MESNIARAWRGSWWVGVPAIAAIALALPAGQAFSADGTDGWGMTATDPGDDPGDEVVTFTRDVAPILQENCQVCHRPGSLGPMSFMTYDEVRPWAPVIKDQVVRRNMPPYHYDTDVGIQELQNDTRLSEEAIETIVRWVDAGAPEGDPADLPEPREFPEPGEWRLADQLGPPDHIIPSEPYTVPATGSDVWWRPVVESGLEEDRCIKAIEVRPSREGWPATHHANSTFRVQNEDGDWVSGGRLTEYALGKLGEVIPEDACRIAPASSRVAWDIHYYPAGEEVVDDVVEIGLWFHEDDADLPYEQTLTLYFLDAGTPGLLDYHIPPHGTLMTQGYHAFDTPVRIDSFQPHGHLRLAGKKLEIYHPHTGERELISQISNWNPGWHLSHLYEPHVAPLVPAGSVLVITAWYDNTANNPWNPDPDQWVGPGDRTTDEMSHAWIAVTHLDDEGYERILAERERMEDEREELAGDD